MADKDFSIKNGLSTGTNTLTVGSVLTVNTTGLYQNGGTINAASHTVGTSTVANSTGVYTGVVNGSSVTVGSSFVANSTGAYHTGIVNTATVNASTIQIGSSLVANATGVYHTGVVNAASHTVGTSTVANSTGVYTGTVNAASHTVGSAFTANSTVVNAVSYYAGSTLIANTTGPYGKTEGNLNVNSASLASKSSTIAQNGGNGAAMTFNWSGQSGQPTWLWGSNDGTNHYVYNPSNFNVNYATSAGAAGTLNSQSASYVCPFYNSGNVRGVNTWFGMPYNGFVTILATGSFMNNLEVYTSPNGGSTSYMIAVVGDDINTSSKGSYVGFPVKAGSYYYVANPGYNYFAGGYGFETVTIWEWYYN